MAALHMSADPERVAVIGGGWAGLAAAVTLARAGVAVDVFEAARQLGGRARRVSVDGMEMDLQQTRYLDFKALSLYCYRVASVVGLLAAEIFGYQDRKTQKYAHDLGMAFQLTNIIRDVGEDARRGRVYLPINELQQFNVPVAAILNARYSDEFGRLMQFQCERAQGYYEAAFAALPKEDRRAQRPGLIMAAIYRTLLEEIARDKFQVLHQRVSLTPIRKLWLAWKTWVTA